jgi:hypothetical protein
MTHPYKEGNLKILNALLGMTPHSNGTLRIYSFMRTKGQIKR